MLYLNNALTAKKNIIDYFYNYKKRNFFPDSYDKSSYGEKSRTIYKNKENNSENLGPKVLQNYIEIYENEKQKVINNNEQIKNYLLDLDKSFNKNNCIRLILNQISNVKHQSINAKKLPIFVKHDNRPIHINPVKEYLNYNDYIKNNNTLLIKKNRSLSDIFIESKKSNCSKKPFYLSNLNKKNFANEIIAKKFNKIIKENNRSKEKIIIQDLNYDSVQVFHSKNYKNGNYFHNPKLPKKNKSSEKNIIKFNKLKKRKLLYQ